VQAITAAGVTKDAQWIVGVHKQLLLDITEGDPCRLLGFLMDNTAANRAAMRLLTEMYPHLLNVGCQAHGLSLFVKDMAKETTNLIAKTFERTNTIVNAINDSEKLRALVQNKQKEVQGKVSVFAFQPHAPFQMQSIDNNASWLAVGYGICCPVPHTLWQQYLQCQGCPPQQAGIEGGSHGR
jgi:hypothetical protein